MYLYPLARPANRESPTSRSLLQSCTHIAKCRPCRVADLQRNWPLPPVSCWPPAFFSSKRRFDEKTAATTREAGGGYIWGHLRNGHVSSRAHYNVACLFLSCGPCEQANICPCVFRLKSLLPSAPFECIIESHAFDLLLFAVNKRGVSALDEPLDRRLVQCATRSNSSSSSSRSACQPV